MVYIIIIIIIMHGFYSYRNTTDLGTHDFKHPVSSAELSYAFRFVHNPPSPVSYEYLRAAQLIMTENNISRMPSDTNEALNLYFVITCELDNFF